MNPQAALANADIVLLYGIDGTVAGMNPGAIVRHVQDCGELDSATRELFSHHGLRVAVLFSDAVPDAEVTAAHEIMEGHSHTARVGHITIMTRTINQGLNVLANMPRLERHGFASSMHGCLKGVPAFVVAAGPSLDDARPLLEQAKRKGAVIAVNTAMAALPVEPDAAVIAESIDVSEHIKRGPKAGLYVLEMQGHPKNYDAAEEKGAGIATVFACDPPTTPLALSLGCMPIPVGGAAATLAYSLCRYWEASPIIFIGQDLAWPDGRAYASGTVYDDMRVTTTDQDARRMVFTGESKRVPEQSVAIVQAFGGEGTLPTSYAMLGQLDWYTSATRGCDDVINTSTRGARIPGTHEETLAEVLARLPDLDRSPLPIPPPVPGWREAVERLRLSAKDVLEHEYPLSVAQRKLPLLTFWMLPYLLETRQLRRTRAFLPNEYGAHIKAGIRIAARTILEHLPDEARGSRR